MCEISIFAQFKIKVSPEFAEGTLNSLFGLGERGRAKPSLKAPGERDFFQNLTPRKLLRGTLRHPTSLLFEIKAV